MYPYQTNTTPQARTTMPIPQMILKGRPVSSLEEVRATGIDFDGSIFYFPDIANKRIYTKQINPDGTFTLLMYEQKELPTPMESSAYVTKQEFGEVIELLKKQMSDFMMGAKSESPSLAKSETPVAQQSYNF